MSIFEAKNGLLQMEFPNSTNSLLGGMIVQTTQDNQIWLRIHPACSGYNPDTVSELIQIMQEVMKDQIIWAISYKGDNWAETTLVRQTNDLESQPGLDYQLYSWSGKLDISFKN